MNNKGKDRFPDDFILGTSTSAFQIEGEGLTEWQGFRGEDGTLLGNGIDHYPRLKDDLEYILYLGDAYRFSMDWSRLQKEPYGELDKDAVKHYSLIVYVKGALFFHHLREKIGDDAFFKALQDYYQSKKYQIASPEDILDVFERASGEQLDDFYQEWLYQKQETS